MWAGATPPFGALAALDLQKRYGIGVGSGGNILPAMTAYKQFPGMEGATYYYFGIPKNPVNEWLVANHYKQFKNPPDFFTAGGMSAAIAVVEALKKTGGDTTTNKLIKTMEGMSFETPKGKMTFRAEDHQAMQSMYHFRDQGGPGLPVGCAGAGARDQAGGNAGPHPQQALISLGYCAGAARRCGSSHESSRTGSTFRFMGSPAPGSAPARYASIWLYALKQPPCSKPRT